MHFPQIKHQAFVLLVLLFALSACNTVNGPSSLGLSLSDEPLVGKFVWHDLITDDTKAAQHFYSGLFGWTFEETTRPGGGPYILAKLNGHYVGGIVHESDPDDKINYSRWLGYLSVANMEKALKTTRSAGGKIAVDARELGSVGQVAAISDPQGAVLGLVRSNHGDPDDSQPAALGHIVWNELLADDDQAAASFYEALAGYKIQTIKRRGGQYIKLNADGRERAGIMQNPIENYPPTWLTYFAVADPVAAAAKVESLGGKVLLPPSAELRESTIAVVEDPSGAVLVLQQWPL
ncbi:MAG: VOC family protein [Gammaproteobacteria bacterium]|nr:MAG: VOC family protein [Gammaproteobacteria bacterium]